MQISNLGFNNTLILNFCLSIHFCNTFIVCLIFYLQLQYLRCVKITFIYNINFHIRFIVFVFFISNMVAPPPITIEGVHWARDGPKFVCKVDKCNASYTSKYNLVWHLWACHNVTLESSKSRHPSIWEDGSRHQDCVAMNTHVLNNPLAQFHHNE
jgi:hypothetical protein